MHRQDDTARWFLRYRRDERPDVRLFCFHHAGGSASIYREWSELLPGFIEPVAVQLPGRAGRLWERPFATMAPLVDALVDALWPMLDRPFACYGLSMGAKVCWALTHRLRELAMPMPIALYLAGAAAPEWREGRTDWELHPEALIAYLREMGGTPPQIFEEPELLAVLLPTLRADLTLVDNFRFHPATPLAVPIRAFAGVDDVEGSAERMHGWRAQTTEWFALDTVPGGHFFDATGERQVIRTITEDLRRELSAAAVVDVP